MKHVFLIGMMGCGKSTCGRLLAQALGVPFLDTDQELERQAGKTIPQIFQEEGEAGFRARETALVRALGEGEGQVIATGGGLPLQAENRQLLREMGRVIFLTRDPGLVYDTMDRSNRPLAQEGREAFLERYRQREPLYRAAAHFTAPNTGSPQETVGRILALLDRD